MGYSYDNSTYRVHDRIIGKKVVHSCEQVQSNALLCIMVDDIDEEIESSDDVEKIYNGTAILESTGSDNIKDENTSVYQDDRMTLLRFRGECKRDPAGVKPLDIRKSRAVKQLAMNAYFRNSF